MAKGSAENKGVEAAPVNFIHQIISAQLEKGEHASGVVTRFPPEPNGYLHIGHAKSIHLNFGIAQKFKGRCNLRFDDTNPLAEDEEYVKSIQEDVKWLGFDWGENLYHASDYFDQLFEFAVQLIDLGLAYVDEQSVDDIRRNRGTLTEPGKPSPNRNRSIQENKELFFKMRSGEVPEGKMVLRAKIDMASPNMNMRDPLLYRIRFSDHQRTGNKWCIYPLYDFTHGLSDMLEGVTHSICTLEFEDHRPLYDWILEVLKTPCHPQQIEFARLNLDYTVMSKRKLLELVEANLVSGWDDPRMPTIQGMRRRGYTPNAIKNFCERLGVTKKNSVIELSSLEFSVREDLDQNARRLFAVVDPIQVTIENWPEGKFEEVSAPYHPKKPEWGERKLKFARNLFIDRDDFLENPPKDFFRLKPGGRVKLRYGYVIECKEVKKDQSGKVTHLICTYDPTTRDNLGAEKVKGIIHWLSQESSFPTEVRSYDRLFNVPNPLEDKEKDFKDFINPQSLQTFANALVETAALSMPVESNVQFERLGFYCIDRRDSTPVRPVFNRTVTLRDTWAKINQPK